MAWTFNGSGSQTTIPNGSHQDIPNGDWSFGGWFRIASNNNSDYRRIFSWGTPGGTPHVQVFIPGDGTGVSNTDHLSARVIGVSGSDTGIIYIPGLWLTSHTNKWLPWTLTHDDSANTTWLRILDRSTSTYYSANSVIGLGAITSTNIAEVTYIGATNNGNDSARFQGDMAEMFFLPGVFFDVNTWHGFIHGGRPHRYQDRKNGGWYVPMLGDRADEEWIAHVTPSSTNVATTIFDGPPVQKTSRSIYIPSEAEAIPATTGLKLSQFNAQVVKDPPQTGHIKVGRLWAEVLISGVATTNTFNESINDVMTLNSSVSLARSFSDSANNTINLTQNVTYKFDREEVADTLNITHSAVAVREIPLGVSSTISLISLGGRSLTYGATQNLGLVSTVNGFNYVADRAPAGNILTLTQCVEVQGSKVVEHALGLTQTVNVQYPYRLSVVTPLTIAQHTSTPYHMWVEDTVGLWQRTSVPLPTQHVTSTLNMIQDSPIGRFVDTLALTQCIQFSFAYEITQTMNITDQVDLEGLWVRSVEHSNIVGHSLTWYEDTPCGRKQYTPFQGENTISSNFTAPRNTLQDPQGDTSDFSLYIPYLGVPTSKVTMRKPELDNRDRNAYTRVNHETRGGKLIVYADPQWPNVRTLAVTIIGLLESEVDELQDFMEETLGQEIGLTDWEGRLWKGIITNPNEVATQDGKKRWTVTFEFEGEMLLVEQPGDNDGSGDGQTMNIQQSVSAVIV